MCKAVYTVPAFIPIRDLYVKVALQTNDSKLDFFFTGELNIMWKHIGMYMKKADLSTKSINNLVGILELGSIFLDEFRSSLL